MKITNIVLAALLMLGLLVITAPATQAQTCDGSGKHFVDVNGDGFNDNAPDEDGDGIPNGLDPDYIKYAQDGTGYMNGKTDNDGTAAKVQEKTMAKQQQKFNRIQSFYGYLFQHRLGALNGTVASGTPVGDGTGGAMNGTGVCDGTGPHGEQKKGGK
jgi:hypothetical protein